MISNEYVVKLLLDYEEKNGERVVKKELDDVEPGVLFGRSFLRLTKGIIDFRNRVITIYPDLDSFHDNSDDCDAIIENVDFYDIPELDGIDVPPYVCNMGKSSRNKKKPCGNYKMTYSDEEPSLTEKTVYSKINAS
ncbi:hypothetical protein Tco_1228813 [Tanacetum coccineum]